jgi:hypothetical protein
LPNQVSDVGRFVLVTSYDSAGSRLFAHVSQWGILGEGRGLDDEKGLRIAPARDVFDQSLGGDPGGAPIFAKGEPDQPPAAHHRNGAKLIDEMGWIALEVGFGDNGYIEWVIGALGHRRGEAARPLSHDALVPAVDQRGEEVLAGRSEKALYICSALEEHR